MVDKNPYENGVDIPDFIETKSEGIDMSVFKMSDDELNTNSQTFDFNDEEFDTEDEQDVPKRKLNAKGIMAVGAALLVVLLVLALVGLIFGLNQKSKYNKSLTEIENLQTQLNDKNNTIVDLQNQISALRAEIEANKTPEVAEDPNGNPVSGTYTANASGLKVRKSPDLNAGFASEADVKGIKGVNYNDGVALMDGKTVFKIYETKEVSGNTWARIASGKDAWVCIKYNGENLATKN